MITFARLTEHEEEEEEALRQAQAKERLKVAIEVLGDHAWVKTWVHHQGVAALLDALVARDAKLTALEQRLESFYPIADDD